MKNYSIETFPLNHFVLWCKGWYRPTDLLEPTEVTLSKVMALDGYSYAKTMREILCVVLTEFESYNDWLKANGKHYLTLSGFCNDIFGLRRKMELSGKEYTIEKLMLYSISVFFMERGKDDIVLKAPVYSRKLFKKGLAFNQTFRRNYNGMTYAEQNRYAKSVFEEQRKK